MACASVIGASFSSGRPARFARLFVLPAILKALWRHRMQRRTVSHTALRLFLSPVIDCNYN